MTDIGTIAMKCSNSKCICQTLNKFSAFIALNSNLRLITDNLSLVAVIFGISSLDMTDIGTIAMKCSNSEQTLNKFGAFIALNSNLRLITFNLKFSCSDIW